MPLEENIQETEPINNKPNESINEDEVDQVQPPN